MVNLRAIYFFMAMKNRVLITFKDKSFVDHLEILVCLLAAMIRLTFELLNDHFNPLGNDDSIV